MEIWPTSIIVPAGYRIGLTIRGTDYEYEGPAAQLSHFKGTQLRGVGIYTHADPTHRPAPTSTAARPPCTPVPNNTPRCCSRTSREQ